MAAESQQARTLVQLDGEEIPVEELIDLARERNAASRNRLVEGLGELYFAKLDDIGADERAQMAEILRQLIREVELAVRRRLAERFAEEPEAPLGLVRALANDAAEVAYPILKASPVLEDAELIRIIRERTMQHRYAIAQRASLSEPVGDALFSTGNTGVIQTLIANHGAALSPATMAILVETSRNVESLRSPLLERRELTSELARRMYWWVSAALRKHIAANFDIDSTELDSKIVDTVRELIGEQAARELPADGMDALAQKLAERGEITADLLIATLRQHQTSLFEALFARLVGLKKTMVRRFIMETGGESLAIACRAATLYKHEFTTIFLLSRSARPGEKVVDPGELARAVAFYDKITPDTARKVVERWHLDPDYLEALKKLKGVEPKPR